MINQSNHALKNPCIDAKSYWREIIYLYGIQNYLNFVETNYNWQNYIFDRHRLVFNLFFDKTEYYVCFSSFLYNKKREEIRSRIKD